MRSGAEEADKQTIEEMEAVEDEASWELTGRQMQRNCTSQNSVQ